MLAFMYKNKNIRRRLEPLLPLLFLNLEVNH